MNAETHAVLEPLYPAPSAYQAEVLRGQIADDINRRFWKARRDLLRDFDGRKQAVERDYARLSADEFLAKHRDWEFA